MLAVDRDVKPRNMNFAKVEKGGGGGTINREGAFIAINTVYIYWLSYSFLRCSTFQSYLNVQACSDFQTLFCGFIYFSYCLCWGIYLDFKVSNIF